MRPPLLERLDSARMRVDLTIYIATDHRHLASDRVLATQTGSVADPVEDG